MSNRVLLIVVIILLLTIAVLLSLFLIFALFGKYEGISIFNSKTIIFDESYEKDLVNEIKVKSDLGDIKLQESQEEKIRVSVFGKSLEDINISFEEGILSVEIKQPSRIFNFGIHKNDVTIYIPKEYSKNINVDASFGDIKIANFENAIMNIEEDCGDIEIQSVKDIVVKNSYGDIKIEKITNKCNIKNNCGDIKINKLEIKEDSSIESDLGDIKIEKTSDIYIDSKVNLGDVKVNENNRHSEVVLKVRNNCGDIKVNY